MKTFLIIIFCAVSICYSSFAQLGTKTQAGKVQGLWQNSDFGYQMTLMLNADGSGEFDGSPITYTTQANMLKIVQDGTTTQYTYTLSGNALKVSGGDLDAPITFTRAGTGSPSTNTQTQVQVPPAKSSTSSTTIIGAWSNYGETIEFKTDGQCTYLGQVYPYQVSGNHVTLQTSQGNIMIAYAVSGNQLTLTVNGQTLTYTKGNGTTAGTNQPANTGGKGRDLSLVGKWCYVNVTNTNSGGTSTDQCITLREDGTYEYYSERSMSANTNTFSSGTSSQNSDRGTWWVEGNRIHYNSQTQGQGSYQLEKRNHPKNKDPMIVLDGTSYVTFYNKPPW